MKIQFTQESRGEIERIQRDFSNQLSENEILRGTASGINSALSRSISRINKQVKAEYNITQKYLSRMAVVSPKANSRTLYGSIKINDNKLPLIAFKAKQKASSISLSIHKGKSVTMRNAFITTMKSGHKGVFSRGQYDKKGGFTPGHEKTSKGKVRITQMVGPSVFAMGVNKAIAQDVQEFMSKDVAARVEGILKSKVDKIVAQNK